MTDVDELRRLNRKTFEVEQDAKQNPESSRGMLNDILGEQFRIKRASDIVQTKKEMIYDVLFETNPFDSRIVSEDDTPGNPTIFKNCGVITSLLTTTEIAENGKQIKKTFRNIKIFVKKKERWQCVSWQVFQES